MKLWVDDERPVPDDSWTSAKTVAEAKDRMIEQGDLEWVSLDYTLSYSSSDSGVDVLVWMIANDKIPTRLTAHSSSWAGRQLIIDVAAAANIEATAYAPVPSVSKEKNND